jgi:hypothetical protein
MNTNLHNSELNKNLLNTFLETFGFNDMASKDFEVIAVVIRSGELEDWMRFLLQRKDLYDKKSVIDSLENTLEFLDRNRPINHEVKASLYIIIEKLRKEF